MKLFNNIKERYRGMVTPILTTIIATTLGYGIVNNNVPDKLYRQIEPSILVIQHSNWSQEAIDRHLDQKYNRIEMSDNASDLLAYCVQDSFQPTTTQEGDDIVNIFYRCDPPSHYEQVGQVQPFREGSRPGWFSLENPTQYILAIRDSGMLEFYDDDDQDGWNGNETLTSTRQYR